MAGQDDQESLRVPILWTCAAFLAVSLVGHLVIPAVDFVWRMIALFGILGVAQAFFFDRSSKRNSRR